jgi:hypothetical protein
MIRSVFTLFLLLLLHTVCAQRELVYTKDPATLRSEEIRITHFNLPASCARYRALRIMDIRPVRGYCGFIRPSSQLPARKISTLPDLEQQLNAAVQIRKDSAVLKDTLVVVLKHFWLFRSLEDDTRMHCRIQALFFTRKDDTLHFSGKADTLLSRSAVIRYEFRDLPALFFEDLLALLPQGPIPMHHPLPVKDFLQQANSWAGLPLLSGRENALLSTFNDFVKARFIPAAFSMRPFDEQYTMLFAGEEQKSRYAGKIWGALYNGELYIRHGRHFSKAYPLERSYFILNNIRSTEGGYAYSYPLLLHPETGRLE